MANVTVQTTHKKTGNADASVLGLIGGIGLTEVHVYNQRLGPDGLFGGCPHVHAVVDEGYYIIRGTGRVEFHDVDQGYRQLELSPGTYAHFPPGVLHRLISDGNLVVLGMMGSAGLAEQGEARIYFGPQVDASKEVFDSLVSMPKSLGLEGALMRRDAAVSAYMKLLALWRDDKAAYMAELRRFLGVHRKAMAGRREEFEQAVRRGPVAWADMTLRRLSELNDEKADPSLNGCEIRFHAREEQAFGMCGVLRPILKPDVMLPRTNSH